MPPQVPVEGSCDCGKITVQLLLPFEQLEVREDNCSICTRASPPLNVNSNLTDLKQNAWTGIYPSQKHVLLKGHENTKEYRFGSKFNGFPFCRTCGINVYQNLYGPPLPVIDSMPEERKALVRQMLDIKPLNVRVFEDVVLSDCNVKRVDQGTEGYETAVLGFARVDRHSEDS